MKHNPGSFKILNIYDDVVTKEESATQVTIQSLTSPETKARIKSRNKQIEKVKEIQSSIKKLQRLIK